MREHMKISDMKKMAKDRLLGNYKISVGALALVLVTVYAVFMMLYSVIVFLVFTGNTHGAMPSPELVSQTLAKPYFTWGVMVVFAIPGALTFLLCTGLQSFFKTVNTGRYPRFSEIFFCFSNRMDVPIKIFLIEYAASVLLGFPSEWYMGFLVNNSRIRGSEFLTYMLIVIVQYILIIILSSFLSMAPLVYLDNPEAGAIACIKTSFRMMKGNLLRYIYLNLTFLGYFIAAMISLGVGLLWVTPYMYETLIIFYEDLKNGVE